MNGGVMMWRPEAWTAAKSQDVVKRTQDVLSLFRGWIIIYLRCRFPSRMGYNVIRDRTVVVRRTAVKATIVQVDCISLIRGGSGMKIAIVDDIKGEAERLSGLVARYLSTHGLFCDQTDLFASGEAFLEHFEPARYDIIFLDIYMSGMTGMETARRIREQDTNCSLLFVTTSPDFAIDSYDVNATYYLLKPVNEAQVTRALDRCNMDRIEHRARPLCDGAVSGEECAAVSA